jgi:putative addiction module CopG family antidote
MADQNVQISGHTQEFVASLVEAGFHKDADAVVKDALDRYEQEYVAKLERLRSAVQAGFDDADAGNSIGLATQADQDAYWADLDRRVSENVAARAAKVG